MTVSEYLFTDDDGNAMPIITLEIMSNSSNDTQPNADMQNSLESSHGLNSSHFATDKVEEQIQSEETDDKEIVKSTRSDLLEYMMRNDGSVICKLCGEILQSRTHWYRHKYKLHVVSPLNPAPLFQCELCLVYFKSRKGYIGHISSKHSETLSDTSPVLTNSQAEAIAKEKTTAEQPPTEDKEKEQEHPDPELAIPRTCVLNYQTTVVKQPQSGKDTEMKKLLRRTSKDSPVTNQAELDEKRSREEKLVADIIDRVRRECEAQGSGGAARRGYSRRYTAMHT